MSSRALLLLNPGARRGGQRRADAIVGRSAPPWPWTLLSKPGRRSGPGPGPAPPRHAAGVDRVIVGGGDGTINLALQALVETETAPGHPPAQAPPTTSPALGHPRSTCRPHARWPRTDTADGIDLGWVNGRYFFTTASIGLSVQITEELSAEIKRRWGRSPTRSPRSR